MEGVVRVNVAVRASVLIEIIDFLITSEQHDHVMYVVLVVAVVVVREASPLARRVTRKLFYSEWKAGF